VVEPSVLPAGVDPEVGRKPTAVAGASADADVTSRWGEDDTPSGTLEEHYQMALSQPFSSCSPCGRRSHHP
jgi:hypothetical protein